MKWRPFFKLFAAVSMLLPLTSCLSTKQMRAQEIQTDIALREMRSELEDHKYQMSRLEVELEIIEGKSDSQVSSIRQMRSELARLSKSEREFHQTTWLEYEEKLKELLKFETNLKEELQNLKKNSQDVLSTLAQFKSKLDENEGQVSKQSRELEHLQASLVSLLKVVEGPEIGQMFYVVQAGDTLEKIADDHQVTQQSLREMNHLSSDMVIIGQKLRLK